MNTSKLNWERVTRRKKPKPDTPWEIGTGRFSRHVLALSSTGEWNSWMLMWTDDPDSGKAWSKTHPTLEEAKTQAQQHEDELAKIWTPAAVESEIYGIITNIYAAHHGHAFAPTDYDKALGHKARKDIFLAATKQAPGNVVDIVAAEKKVTVQWARELQDWAQEGARDNLITADEAETVIRATDTLLGMLE
jgi:hypothetical protein